MLEFLIDIIEIGDIISKLWVRRTEFRKVSFLFLLRILDELWRLELVKVRVLKSGAVPFSANEQRSVDSPKIQLNLNRRYVRILNEGIAYRIQEGESVHANNTDLVAKARFR